jgi:hypothetical protein
MLTGCDLNAGPFEPALWLTPCDCPGGWGVRGHRSLLATTPKNRALFHVGRVALSDGKDGKRDNGQPADLGEKQKEPKLAGDLHSSDAASGFLDQDEGWYYMNIDQDGTYLFFGDLPDTDDMMTNGDEERFYAGRCWYR